MFRIFVSVHLSPWIVRSASARGKSALVVRLRLSSSRFRPACTIRVRHVLFHVVGRNRRLLCAGHHVTRSLKSLPCFTLVALRHKLFIRHAVRNRRCQCGRRWCSRSSPCAPRPCVGTSVLLDIKIRPPLSMFVTVRPSRFAALQCNKLSFKSLVVSLTSSVSETPRLSRCGRVHLVCPQT